MIDIALAYLGRSPVALQALLYTCAGLLLICIGLGVAVEIQSTRLTAANATIGKLQVEKKSLGEQISTQNRAVELWKGAAVYQAQRAEDAAKKAEQIRTVTVERVREVTVASIPQSCPESDGWLINWGLQFNARWEAVQ